MSRERSSEQRTIDWQKLIEEALTVPGSLGQTYSKFYNYSFLNQMYLRLQGVREPVATYQRWQEIGRQVVKGAKAKEIIRPIFAKPEPENKDKEPTPIGFKSVKCIFTLSETEGPELPPIALPEWDEETALAKLHVRRVRFDLLNGNIQGFSQGRDIGINPIAANPRKTLVHELGHIVLGHTVRDKTPEIAQHLGIREFEAESTAYLTLNELGQLDEQTATVSRGYIRHWLDDEHPPDSSIRRVFSATDTILKAGRAVVSKVMEGNR